MRQFYYNVREGQYMNFETRLREKKLKVTPQRMAILNEIQKNGHISIEDIYENIKKVYPSISLATVYKNITSLYEANLLREIKAPSHKQKYELTCDRHIHVACEKCGKLEDVRVGLEEAMNLCSSATNYQLYDVSAVFLGLCAECAQNVSKREGK